MHGSWYTLRLLTNPILFLHRYGPWNSMLTVLFPDDQGFIITPQRRIPEDSQSHIPDFVIEVVKLTSPPLTFRTVLIVEIKNSQHWPGRITSLDNQISRQADAAFAGTAHTKVYWIGTIGPHWRYGERYDNRQDIVPLIHWHDITHDAASYADLQELARLVREL